MNVNRKTRRIAAAIAVMTAVALNLAGCSGNGNGSAATAKDKSSSKAVADKNNKPETPNQVGQPSAKEVQIVIENFAFVPSELTIAPGTKVTWVNKDEAPHTATSSEKKFNSGGLDTDESYSFVFNDKGEFPYFCTLHPHMMATITVK